MIAIEGGVLPVHLLGHDDPLTHEGLDLPADQIIVACPRRPRQVARARVLVTSHLLLSNKSRTVAPRGPRFGVARTLAPSPARATGACVDGGSPRRCAGLRSSDCLLDRRFVAEKPLAGRRGCVVAAR